MPGGEDNDVEMGFRVTVEGTGEIYEVGVLFFLRLGAAANGLEFFEVVWMLNEPVRIGWGYRYISSSYFVLIGCSLGPMAQPVFRSSGPRR